MRIPERRYRRLTDGERKEISRGLAVGERLGTVARRLGRPPSTVWREVRRNRGKSGYRAYSASRRVGGRRLRPPGEGKGSGC